MARPCTNCGSSKPRASGNNNNFPGATPLSRLDLLCGKCYLAEKDRRRKSKQ